VLLSRPAGPEATNVIGKLFRFESREDVLRHTTMRVLLRRMERKPVESGHGEAGRCWS
jgi:hypothetical protein